MYLMASYRVVSNSIFVPSSAHTFPGCGSNEGSSAAGPPRSW
jgi:hypothetical protein